jgi:hypothetical protein
VIQHAPHQLHVLNAPSPAATSALEIASYLLAEAGIPGRSRRAAVRPSQQHHRSAA